MKEIRRSTLDKFKVIQYIDTENRMYALTPLRPMRNKVQFLVALFAIFLFAGCASTQKTKENERELLRKRAQEYWQSILSGKLDIAYLMEVPAYREKFSIGVYMGRFKLTMYSKADVREVILKKDDANVMVTVSYKLMIRKLMDVETVKNLQEDWVKIDKVWYHIPDGFEFKKEQKT